jgi:hypothetical protein
MHVVRKEEKEARLKDFVSRHLSGAAGAPRAPHVMSVIARGFDSPVVLALSAVSADLAAAGCHVRLMIVQRDGVAPSAAVLQSMAHYECRLGCDTRLLDAHEQLLIGDRTAWIGDCMRREPAKRDAYECYSADCQQTATFVQRAFDRIWTAGLAVQLTAHAGADVCAKDAGLIDPALAALAGQTDTSVVSTRH